MGILLPLLSLVFDIFNFKSYNNLFFYNKNLKVLKTTIDIALKTLILNFLIGLPAASVLYKNNNKLLKIGNGLVYLPVIIPSFVITLSLHYEFIKLNLIETEFGVVLVHTLLTLPYFIKSLISGYKTIDNNYYTLGKIAGANSFEIFYNISLPKLFPSIIIGSSLVIIVSFAQYITTLIIGGGRIITLPILIYPYISSGDLKNGALLSSIFIILNLFLLILLEKFLSLVYTIGVEKNAENIKYE
ncbi:MAG: ABC transporter permease [Fusobacteriaceae bacterium]